MKILHLKLKKEWFDMVASGEKTEEYRAMSDHWKKRLEHKDFDAIRFQNGYAKDAPWVLVEFEGMGAGQGNRAWGAPEEEHVYILRLGKILSRG